MKKILAFILVLLMILSVGMLTGCNNTDTDTATPDSVSTTANSELAGVWKLSATGDEIMWQMNSQKTLHITTTSGDKKYTVVCNYTYLKDTGEFTYTALNANDSFEGTATLQGSRLSIVSKDGKIEYNLIKQSME